VEGGWRRQFVYGLLILAIMTNLFYVLGLPLALGVGIGFGLQTIVNNFVCGLILLLERPLRVGDTIELGGQLAKIAKIGLRSTTVRTVDQADVIVHNNGFITNCVARAVLCVLRTNRSPQKALGADHLWHGLVHHTSRVQPAAFFHRRKEQPP
jgi:hypothetical protein